MQLSTIESIEPEIINPWREAGFDVIYQRCMLGKMPPGPDGVWPLVFPEIPQWTSRTVVILNATDFLTVRAETPTECAEIQRMEQHFGDRCDQVVVLIENINMLRHYRGPLHLIYFPTIFYVFCRNMAATQHRWIYQLDVPRHRNWQCLNGRIDARRRTVYELLRDVPHGVLNLGDEAPLEILDYSSYLGITNEENFQRLLPIYQDCKINIVTETCYAAGDGGLTEKILMAYMAQQIPIAIGHCGLVENLEAQGFDMFRDIINTDYDSIEHNNRRPRTAIDSNMDLLLNGVDLAPLRSRLSHNQQHALTGWPDSLIQRYLQSVLALQERW